MDICYAQNANEKNIQVPEASPGSIKRQNLLVTVTGKDKIFAGNKELFREKLDSMLRLEINNKKRNITDTVTVIINADTSAHYIIVFEILQSAKKAGAIVVANINTGNQ